MATDVSGTLAAIDSALEDCTVGEEAMRWNPDAGRVICDGGDVLWPELWSPLRHGTYHYNVTAILDGTEQVIPLDLEDGQGNPLHGTITLTPIPDPVSVIRSAILGSA